MTKKEREEVQLAIENEGFDYGFRFYSTFDTIKDAEFQRLRLAYVEAAQELADYVEVE